MTSCMLGNIACFNPCFDGLPFRTFCTSFAFCLSLVCFNPCFDGLPFRTFLLFRVFFQDAFPVSILVLMDYLFGRGHTSEGAVQASQFQSLF